MIPLVGRGQLTSALVHGQPLYVHAARTLTEALADRGEVVALVEDERLDEVTAHLRQAGLHLSVRPGRDWRPAPGRWVVHDPLCPLTPASFIADLVSAPPDETAVVAYRPVTDTIKTVVEEMIAGTVDREGLAALTSPAVFSVAEGDDAPPLSDFGALLASLRARGPVRLVRSPAMGRRVDDTSSINLLECVDELGHQLTPR